MAQIEYSPKAQLRDSLREFLKNVTWRRPIALSLTLKQRMKEQRLDHYAAVANFRHFMNRLNRQIFGSAARRNGKGLMVFPVIEHSETVRIHNHAILDQPEHADFEGFKAQIESCWLKTTWGYKQFDVVPVTNEGWIDYLTKTAQKPEYDLAIDWINTRLN